MIVWKAVVFAVGIVLLVTDFWDLMRSLVIPRSWARGPVVLFVSTLRTGARQVINRSGSYATRDRLLASLEPLLLLVRLGIWLGVALVGFGLLNWSTESMSIGVAVLRHDEDADKLLQRADMAMLSAKSIGGSNVMVA